MEEEDEKVMDVEEDPKEEVDEDSSSDEGDEESQKKIEMITQKLSASPYDYQSHIDLIEILRKIGEFQKLQDARSRMANIFPLTQNLWLDWIEDEKKFAETDEDHERVVELFERAVKDYICPEIWLEYSQYCIRWMGTEEGMQKIRDVMERSLMSAGLHVTKGAALWETYREFENAMLLTLQPKPGSVPSPEEQGIMKKQMERIESLFKRQLSVPLQGMESTLEELTELSEGDLDTGIRHSYEHALKHLEKLMPLEEALQSATEPKLEEYQNYITRETKAGDLARVQCIYERAIAGNCLNSELWIQYLKYLNFKLKQGDVVVQAHQRSVRNCPWVGKLWVQYLLAMERNNAPKEKIANVFEEALLAGFSTAVEYVGLWRTRCEQVRRRLSATSSDSQDKEELRNCFTKATQYIAETLMTAFQDTGDPDYSMWSFWARCEVGCLNDKEKAVEVLQTLLQNDPDARRKLCLWKEYYNIERLHGGDDKIEKCRSILRQAVQNCAIMPDADHGGVPDAEVACGMLLDFERDHGSLEEMDESLRRVNNKMARVTKRKEKGAMVASQQYNRHAGDGRLSNKGRGAPRKRKISEEEKKQSFKSREHPTKGKDFREHPKRAKVVEDSPPGSGFKAPSGLPMRYGKQSPTRSPGNESEQKITEPPPGFKAPPGYKGPPPPGFKGTPPPGFKDPSDSSSKFDINNNKDRIAEASSEVEKSEKNAQIESSTQETNSEKAEEEKATIFISNLDYKLQNVEERMRSIFCDCGNIIEIRMMQNNKGQFRGFGFLQFEDQKSVLEALKLDRQDIDGRAMYVSPNVDKRKQPNFKVQFKYDLGLEKHKLFVSNISFHTTEETLQKEFSAHGDIKNLRIVTNRSGRSKGLAYIEFLNEAEAAQAVLKMDGKDIDGFEIQVAISNPPSRRPTGGQTVDSASTLGSGGRDQFKGGRGRGRTQMSMLPRSLHKTEKVSNGGADAEGSKPSTSSGGLSNKDFAKLLLKK